MIIIVVATLLGVSLLSIIAFAFCLCVRRRASLSSFNGEDDELQLEHVDKAMERLYFHITAPDLTFQDVVNATNGFSPSCEIGRGAAGTVYKAQFSTGKVIAVKRIPARQDEAWSPAAMDGSFDAEIKTLGKVRHNNIVKLYGFCYHEKANLLLYEFMQNGSLGEHLHGTPSPRLISDRGAPLSSSSSSGSSVVSGASATLATGTNKVQRNLDWDARYQIALGAAQGLAYLHHDCKPAIVHRDIKCNNILLDENMKAHVGDFGLAKLIDAPYSVSASAIAGSYGYIAPGKFFIFNAFVFLTSVKVSAASCTSIVKIMALHTQSHDHMFDISHSLILHCRVCFHYENHEQMRCL